MTSRFNPKPNVVYKRSWRGKFCPNNTQKWNSASSTQNWGGEFSIGTLGKFHPALTQMWDIHLPTSCHAFPAVMWWRSSLIRKTLNC